jgi:hypothetical protein|nr:MAG TPA: hypothetical protein [Caudoviricetes sp.]
MKEQITKLLSVKSLVTLILTVLFFCLAIQGALKASDVLTIYTVVISFYFGTQHEKKVQAEEETDTPDATGTAEEDNTYEG